MNPDEMQVFRKGKRRKSNDGREKLPYDVHLITPPPRYLGRYILDPNTNCGDILETSSLGEQEAFVVKRVKHKFKYRAGRYQMFAKEVDVTQVARAGVEAFLERLVDDDPKGEKSS